MEISMNIKKKILGITIAPVIILGLISMFLTTTMVRSAMLEEIEEALRGTAAATLAAYDQNTGDYLQTSNGDIWKGSYNISKSESLVDRIKGNTGMDVTFFYGDTRIMTSAVDAGGNRVLNSKAGDPDCGKGIAGWGILFQPCGVDRGHVELWIFYTGISERIDR